jgi:hypothetical protein
MNPRLLNTAKPRRSLAREPLARSTGVKPAVETLARSLPRVKPVAVGRPRVPLTSPLKQNAYEINGKKKKNNRRDRDDR